MKSIRERPAAALWAAAVLFLFSAGLVQRWSATRSIDSAESFKIASRIDYFEFGRSLREVGVLGWSGQPSAFRGPLYPALLSWIESYRPDRRPRMPALQAAMGALAAPVAAAAGLELFSPAAGLAASALVALHPEMSASIPGCRIETIFGLMMSLVGWMMIRWSRRPTWEATFLLAFAVGVSLLCRAVLFAFPLLLLCLVLSGVLPSPGRGKLWLLILGPYLLLAPWVLRNAVQFKRFIPFEDRAATRNFYAASLGLTVNSDSGPYQDILAIEHDPQGTLAAEPEEHMLDLARRNVAAAPAAYAASCARRLIYILRLHPWLFLLAFAGAVRRRSVPGVRALSMLCLYYVLAHVPMTLERRYFEPLLPAVMILAAGLVAEFPAALASPFESDLFRRAAPASTLFILGGLYGLCVERLAAETLLTQAPCRLPQTPLAAADCGAQLFARGQREEAAALWRAALAALPTDPLQTPMLRSTLEGQLIMASDTDALASTGAGCSSSAALSRPDAVQQVALRLQDGGRLADALRLYDAILACHPNDAHYLSDRAVAHTLDRREDLAEADLRRALQAIPNDPRASYNLGMLLERRGRRNDALAVYAGARNAFHSTGRPTEDMPLRFLTMISLRMRALSGAEGETPRLAPGPLRESSP